MSVLNTVIKDLREKRLWPVAAALLVALLAVPLLLSNKVKSVPTAHASPPVRPATTADTVPVVSIQPLMAHSRLSAQPSRDPFTQPQLPAPKPSAAGTGTTPSLGTFPSGKGSSGSGSSSPSGSAPASSTGSAPAAGSSSRSSTVTAPPAPRPTVTFFVLSADLAFGKVGAIAPKFANVTRLTPFPSQANPILVFLGIKSDRKTVLFLVSSLASPSGEGGCAPSSRRCEFLSMKVGQRELLLVRNSNGSLTEYKLGVTALHLTPTTTVTKATTPPAVEQGPPIQPGAVLGH